MIRRPWYNSRSTKEVVTVPDYMLGDAQTLHALTPLFVGYQDCPSGYSFGPHIRDYYLIHFCLDGRGILYDRHGDHSIGKGQMFVIRPCEVTTYTADTATPWTYVWIAFRGDSAAVFDNAHSVYDTPREIEDKLTEYIKNNVLAPEIYISILFELIYLLFHEPQKTQTLDKLGQIKRYIKYNYMLPLTVEGLAKSFGFERSYLYRIFKQRYGVGVKQYLVSVRMKNAVSFLKNGFSVSECAAMVGYEDEFNFSKAFKRYFGYAPSRALNR